MHFTNKDGINVVVTTEERIEHLKKLSEKLREQLFKDRETLFPDEIEYFTTIFKAELEHLYKGWKGGDIGMTIFKRNNIYTLEDFTFFLNYDFEKAVGLTEKLVDEGLLEEITMYREQDSLTFHKNDIHNGTKPVSSQKFYQVIKDIVLVG